jgi:hypothetical protein
MWSLNVAGLGACIGDWTASLTGPGDGGSTATDASHD